VISAGGVGEGGHGGGGVGGAGGGVAFGWGMVTIENRLNYKNESKTSAKAILRLKNFSWGRVTLKVLLQSVKSAHRGSENKHVTAVCTILSVLARAKLLNNSVKQKAEEDRSKQLHSMVIIHGK